MLQKCDEKWRYGKSPSLAFFYEGDLPHFHFQKLTVLSNPHILYISKYTSRTLQAVTIKKKKLYSWNFHHAKSRNRFIGLE